MANAMEAYACLCAAARRPSLRFTSFANSGAGILIAVPLPCTIARAGDSGMPKASVTPTMPSRPTSPTLEVMYATEILEKAQHASRALPDSGSWNDEPAMPPPVP